MTSAEEHQQQNGPQGSSEGGEESRNRRRNRRGRGNRGRDQRREDGQQAPSNEEHSSPSPAPQAGGGSSESQAESPSPNGDERRRSRNRRRNRRGRPGDDAENASENTSAPVGDSTEAPASPVEGSEAPAPIRREGQRPQRGQQPQKRQQPPQEKKERPPRGSVLNRRTTRGEYDDAPKQKEETPVYTPVVAATVESYVSQHRGWQKEVLATLRTIVKSAAPDIEEGIMWSQPVFSYNGPVCYIKAFSDTINFGFWRGTELSDDEGLLSGDLTKMRHITIRSAKDVKKDLFESMVRQAVKLNRDKGDPTLS